MGRCVLAARRPSPRARAIRSDKIIGTTVRERGWKQPPAYWRAVPEAPNRSSRSAGVAGGLPLGGPERLELEQKASHRDVARARGYFSACDF